MENQSKRTSEALPRWVGKYELLALVGRGGMSEVYLARDRRLNKQWAVKEIKGKLIAPTLELKSALTEAELLKQLDHPALPRIVDILEDDERETVDIIMDFVEGKNLKALIGESEGLSQEQVVGWMLQVCDALCYLHSRNPPVIYRDVKPENLMVNMDGKVKMVDFGIARRYKPGKPEDTQPLGTPGYAAPEQFRGKGQTDARTDIYGVGTTMYHLLSGYNPADPPYERFPLTLLRPELSKGLEKIIQKCTMQNPDKRYQSCEELIYDLTHFEELEDEYRHKERKSLLSFGLAAAGAAAAFAVMWAGSRGMVRTQHSVYSELISQAASCISASIADGGFSEEAVELLDRAIEVLPLEEEAYQRMFYYYIRMGQIGDGMDKLTACLNRDPKGAGSSGKLCMLAANAYFHGISGGDELLPDYERAAQYYAKADQSKIPEAKYCLGIAQALCMPSNLIDWPAVIEEMAGFENYIDGMADDGTKAENYLSLAEVCLANRGYLLEQGKDPFAWAMRSLEKAESALKYRIEERDARIWMQEIRLKMGETCRLSAIYSDPGEVRQKLLKEALHIYDSLADRTETLGIRKKVLLAAAFCCSEMKDYQEACGRYRQIIREFPDCIEGYTEMGTIALTAMADAATARDCCERAEALPGSGQSRNLKVLREKLKAYTDGA